MRANAGSTGEEIVFTSIREDLTGYTWSTLWSDLCAAMGVAFVTVPQAMAFSLVAGLPLSSGLFAAIYSSILAAIFGSSRTLIVGPTNTIAVLVQFGTAALLHNHYRDVSGMEREILALQILTQLTLMVGLFQIFAAFFKLGRLTQFVSHSVVVGYLLGTAIAICVDQFFTFTGIPEIGTPATICKKLIYLAQHLGDYNLPTLLIGLVSLILLLFLARFERFPTAVIVLVCSGFLVHFLGFSTFSEWGGWVRDPSLGSSVILVGDAGSIGQVFPKIALPDFDFGLIGDLLPIVFAIALLSSVETILVAKTIASTTGQNISVNQEMFGLGVANFFSAFIGGLPSCGSASRSALLLRGGAKTRFASILSSMCVALVLILFGYFVHRIPLTALAAILFVSAVRIVNYKHLLLCLRATSADALVLVVTVLSCLFFGLDVAFYVGVILSVTLHLTKASVPYFVECTYDETGQINATSRATERGVGQIRVINVQGELFFGAADLFQKTLESITCEDSDLKVIILRLKNARDIDATACLALQQLNHFLKKSGRQLLLCGLTYPTWQILSLSGTVDVIGKENLFIADEKEPRVSLHRALLRAREVMGVCQEKEITPLTLQEVPVKV